MRERNVMSLNLTIHKTCKFDSKCFAVFEVFLTILNLPSAFRHSAKSLVSVKKSTRQRTICDKMFALCKMVLSERESSSYPQMQTVTPTNKQPNIISNKVNT
jgi:hypothetical protein